MELRKHGDRQNLFRLTATALFALYSGGTYADIVSTGGTLTGVSVPLPAGLPLLFSGIAGLGMLTRRRARTT